jgi:hypothetical protein
MPTRPPSIGFVSLPHCACALEVRVPKTAARCVPELQRENKAVETKFRGKSMKKGTEKKIPSRDPAVLTGAFAVESRRGAQLALPLTGELGPRHRSLWRSAVGPPACAAVRRGAHTVPPLLRLATWAARLPSPQARGRQLEQPCPRRQAPPLLCTALP